MLESSFVLIRELAANSLARNKLKRKNLSTYLAKRIKSEAQPNSNKRIKIDRRTIRRTPMSFSLKYKCKKTKMKVRMES